MSLLTRVQSLTHPFTRKGWWHWLRFAILLTLGGFVGHLLSDAPWLTQVRYSIYHRQLLMRDRSQLYPQRTALILLNDDDYWGPSFQSRTPLKRDQLADVVEKLNTLGVNTIALDVDLRSPLPQKPGYEFSDYTAEDAKLVGSIQDMCAAGHHVVLASSIQDGDDGYEEMPSIYTTSLPKLPCVERGYIQLPKDMRRMPGLLPMADDSSLNSLALAVTKIADPTAYAAATAKSGEGFRFSEYLTADDFAPKNGRQFVFNGIQLKTMDTATLRTNLADKIVFVGANWHANAYGIGPYIDDWNSPGGMEPGVMLHANFVEAMLDRTGTFTAISTATAEILEIALALVLAMIGVLEIHTAWKWAALAIGLVFSLLFTYTLLQNLGVFLDFLIPMLMIVFHTLGEEVIQIWHEFQHLKQHANQAATLPQQEVKNEISVPTGIGSD